MLPNLSVFPEWKGIEWNLLIKHRALSKCLHECQTFGISRYNSSTSNVKKDHTTSTIHEGIQILMN